MMSMPNQRTIERLRIVLIKPSKYDDDGYVIRFWKSVLPSNTLNVLHGLTDDIIERKVFGDLPIEVTTFDETAEKVPLKKIVRWSREPGTKLLVCLVGVQTNQFPRALDMAKTLRAEGLTVIIGGFHTSGTINMLGEQEPDIQELVRESICIVSGEVEGKWEMILADFLHDRLKPIYSFAQDLQNLVNIEAAPLPKTSPKTMRHFAFPTFGTAETSRGCPFACSFCTIINVQGRKSRWRTADDIERLLVAGAARVVVGTRALEAWDWFKELVHRPQMSRRIVLAVDAKDGMVATRGWTHTTGRSAVEIAGEVSGWPLGALLYTDVAKDGMMSGPNYPNTAKLVAAGRVPVIASETLFSLRGICRHMLMTRTLLGYS